MKLTVSPLSSAFIVMMSSLPAHCTAADSTRSQLDGARWWAMHIDVPLRVKALAVIPARHGDGIVRWPPQRSSERSSVGTRSGQPDVRLLLDAC